MSGIGADLLENCSKHVDRRRECPIACKKSVMCPGCVLLVSRRGECSYPKTLPAGPAGSICGGLNESDEHEKCTVYQSVHSRVIHDGGSGKI